MDAAPADQVVLDRVPGADRVGSDLLQVNDRKDLDLPRVNDRRDLDLPLSKAAMVAGLDDAGRVHLGNAGRVDLVDEDRGDPGMAASS